MGGIPAVVVIKELPEWYNPNVDGGRYALELFLDWDEPPDSISIRKTEENKNIAIAHGGHQFVV